MKQIKQTSREAYESVKPVIPTHHKLILSVLSETVGATYKEISDAIYMKCVIERIKEASKFHNPNTVSRRMLELINSKKVKYGEIRKCTIGGRNCQTYLVNK